VKIAFYSPSKPLSHPVPSGEIAIARGLLRYLAARGHDCAQPLRFRSRWFWKTARGRLDAVRTIVRALQYAAAARPDLWITYHTYYKSPDLAGPIVRRLLKIPYVLLETSYATRWRKLPQTRFGFYCNRIALKSADHLFTNSLADIAGLRRIVPIERITHVPSGIFPEDFERNPAAGASVRARHGIGPGAKLLLSAALMRPGVKFESLAHLIRSLALLTGKDADFTLLVAGDGPMEPELRRMAQTLLPGRVIFAGRIAREEMSGYYSAADLFVYPGIRESIGMVYLEAQACGLPVVALETPGSVQVVRSGETGILVSHDGGRALADAVKGLLDDPALREKMSANAREFVREEKNLWKNYAIFGEKIEAIVKGESG
jgi:glycosyltransferase involved in cell wall biosynthesis